MDRIELYHTSENVYVSYTDFTLESFEELILRQVENWKKINHQFELSKFTFSIIDEYDYGGSNVKLEIKFYRYENLADIAVRLEKERRAAVAKEKERIRREQNKRDAEEFQKNRMKDPEYQEFLRLHNKFGSK